MFRVSAVATAAFVLGRVRYGRAVSYQVFARKYRPQVFDDVLGQEHVVQTLKNAVLQRRLAPAYLFVGPRGTGKTSTARILAKALNCVHGPTVTPCGVCDSCREISQGISLDVLEIDGASNNSVDQIRELRDNVRFAPVRGRYKVYIIDEVHMLTQQAFNALLKTLEEPPAHVIFVFATTEVHRVLPTILSRCQRFDLRRIPTRVIARHLLYIAGQEGVHLSTEAAEAVAVAADGGLRDAESMLDQLVAFCGNDVGEAEVLQVFGLTAERVVIDIFEAIVRRDTAAALAHIDRQAEAGKDLSRLLGDLLSFGRNLLVYKVDPGALREEVSDATRAALEGLAPQLETAELLRLIGGLADTESVLKWSANKRMHLEIGAIRAVQGLEEVGLDTVLEALQQLRGGGGVASTGPARPGGALAAVTAAAPKPATAPEPAAASPSAGAGRATGLRPTLKPEERPAPPATDAGDGGLRREEGLPARRKGENAVLGATDQAVGAPVAPRSTPPDTVPSSQDPAKAPAVDPKPADLAKVWPQILAEVRGKRPLLLVWLEQAVPVSAENGVVTLGFPEDGRNALEGLLRPNYRKFLETLLSERLGGAYRLEGSVRTGLSPLPAADTAAPDPDEAFKKDPLIQRALEIFRAEIQPGEPV